MVEGQGKEKEKFDFTSEGEAVNYISLAQAGVLAMQTARETPGEYGSQYQDVPMAFEVSNGQDTEDYYIITLSFRPQGTFSGSPGQEQFFIEKEGTVAHRQVVENPGRGRRFPVLPVALGLVIVGVIAVVAVIFAVGGSGDDGGVVAVAAPTEAPVSIVAPIPPTDTPIPPTDTPKPLLLRKPTYTPFPEATPRMVRVTATPRPMATRMPTSAPTPTPTLVPPIPTPMAILEATYVLQWGTGGSRDGQFSSPAAVAVDGSGNVYVADRWNHRIQKFSSSGKFLAKWGTNGFGDGQFEQPTGIAVDGSGNVYVSDGFNHRIQKFSSSGVFLAKWGTKGSGDGQFVYPLGVAVDGSGNVYIAGHDNHRIQKFSSSGVFLAKWGTRGSRDGQFHSPAAVAVDGSGNVYVSDGFNHRIQKFSSSGTFLAKWGTKGSRDGQFLSFPRVAVDGSGNVYVVDGANFRIQKFSSSGVFLAKWGTEGSGDGQFQELLGIAVVGSGTVYVIDKERIQKFVIQRVEISRTEGESSLEIGTNGDALEFSESRLSAASGSQVTLTFNNGSLVNQHNWVLVQNGTKDAVATDGTGAGPRANWIKPGDDRVVASSKLLNPGGSEAVTFTAPAAGTYQFVCTFPGHNFTMFGDFTVK